MAVLETAGTETQNLFRIKGRHHDEICVEFPREDDRLYVSCDVLCCASPVFNAMFRGSLKTKEREDEAVRIKDLNLNDFEEFLFCIYPGTLREVNGK